MYNALIKTHHVTSRKKIAQLKKAADLHSVYALLRVGGTPGVMYVEGSEESVKGWLGIVHVRESYEVERHKIDQMLSTGSSLQGPSAGSEANTM